MLFWLITLPHSARADSAKAFVLQQLEASENPSGCSCSVMNAKNEYLLSADLLDKASAIIRVEGRKLDMKFVSTTEKKKEPKKGDTFTRVYSNGPTTLKLNYKTISACPPDSETCEVTRYAVDGLLQNGKHKQNLKHLRGECGC